LEVVDVNGDGAADVAVGDRDGLLLLFPEPPLLQPGETPETARNLGTVVHFIEQTRTIVPGHDDAYFKLFVPTEAAVGAGDEVLDFSGLFEATSGAGLQMEVLDADGNMLASGERFRIRAAQGQELLLHVFGVEATDGTRGCGAYTLVIDVLPQLVSVEAQALLPGTGANPGGPTTSLVLTLQGDRLDPATAENPANYSVTSLGPDGSFGTEDDQQLAIDEIVYSPSTNVEISSGLTYPTAVRQTVALLFADALPAGSYRIELASGIQTAPFNEMERELVTSAPGFTGHPVVSLTPAGIEEGARVEALDLVLASGELGDLTVFTQGTAFLSQTHADLGALLDATLTEMGEEDDGTLVTDVLLDNLLARLAPSLGTPGQRPTALMALWLDPVSIDLESSSGGNIDFNLETGIATNTTNKCYMEVGGNVEIIVCGVSRADRFRLRVRNVPASARGGVVLVDNDDEMTSRLTSRLRSGVTEFEIGFD
jgi:hypothetical protein